MDNNALYEVLAEVFEAGEPTYRDGPAAVFARADRMRSRQRMTSALAVSAAVVAAATVVVSTAGLSAGHGSGGTGGLAAGAPGGGSATPSVAHPPVPPSERPMRAPDFDVSATFTRLLASAGSIGHTSTSPGLGGGLNVRDSKGTTLFEVDVQLNMTALVGPIIDCGARNLPAGTQCNVVTRSDGSRMLTSDGPDEEGTTAARQNIQQRTVDLLYPDGRRVAVTEWNAVDAKRGTVTRPTPLLTLDQLITLATAPDWTK